jgi:acetoin:2,6-dichlorophenolindophenol oxidoreductase subunit beta
MTKSATRKLTMAQAINAALDEALEADPRVVVFGEDIADPAGGTFKVTKGLTDKHGNARVRETPISEQAIAGAAVGAALAGLIPVAEIMVMDFLTLAMDQFVSHAAKLHYMTGGRVNVPLTIRTAGVSGMGFGGQHSNMLEAWFCHVPGLKVVIPSSPADAKGLLRSCIEDSNPCLFIEPARLYFRSGLVPEGSYTIPLGQADTKRQGRDVTVVSYGWEITEALAAAEAVAKEGIDAEVVDLRTLSPWDDRAILASVARTKRCLIVHEGVRAHGVGAEVAAVVSHELHGELAAPVTRLGAVSSPPPYARELEALYTPDRTCISDALRQMMGLTE